MNTNFVKMGQNSFAPEWFDFDRSEKMVSFFGDTPEADDSPDFDEVEKMTCPECKSENLEYLGEVYDDDYPEGSFFECNDCGLRFTEEDVRNGTW